MKSKIIVMLFLLTGSNSSVFSQGEKKISAFNNMYFGAEIGQSRNADNFIIGTITVQLDHHYFKIKIITADDDQIPGQDERFKDFHKNCDCEQERVGIHDIAFMYGKSYRILKHHQIQFGSGISAVIKTDLDEEFSRQKQEYLPDQFKSKFTIGLPAEIRYSFQFKRHLALSCSATANANFLKSYAGWSAGLAIGLF